MEMESPVFIERALPYDMSNGKGHITLRTNKRRVTSQHMPTCQASLPDMKGCKHDILLPDRAEGLPHPNGCLHCPQLILRRMGSFVLSRENTATRRGAERTSLPRASSNVKVGLLSNCVRCLIEAHACTSAKYNIFSCLTDGGHLVQNCHNDRMMWCN
jgi:hypothetical protein